MKKLKKLVAVALATALLVTALVNPAKAFADSGSCDSPMNGSKGDVAYFCSFWGEANFWDVEWGCDGYSKAAWYGADPYNADYIGLTNTIRCSGIGSMSAGASPSGPNVSTTLSGHSVSYSYSVYDDWRIWVDFNYSAQGLLGAWNFSMDVSATFQFGNHFFSITT